MGNGHVVSPKQIITNIYSSISKSIIQSIQTEQSTASSSQYININCDDDAVEAITEDMNTCVKTLKKAGKDDKTILKLCKPAIQCINNNISMKTSLNVTNILNQKSEIKSNIKNSMSNKISQNLRSEQSFILTNADKSSIKSITDIVSENIDDILQSLNNSVRSQQLLTLNNYSANNITIDNASNVIINSVQNLEGIQDNVTNISNSITQQLSSKTNSFTILVTKIFSVFIGIFVILFSLIFFLKRNDTREFIEMISPYAIFIICISVIIAIHLIFKPNYIMLDTHTKYKQISRQKFAFYMCIYSIIIGLAEIIYYKIIKNNNNI